MNRNVFNGAKDYFYVADVDDRYNLSSFVRSIGITRAKAATALTCLVYNIFRHVQINKYQPQLIASME